MTEISCYHIHSNRNPRNIVFIKYEQSYKIILDSHRAIVLSISTFMNIPNLFEYYLLSLLTTERLDNIEMNDFGMIMNVEMDWKRLRFADCFSEVEILVNRNPLLSMEPKRQTSNKKIRKFIKNFNRDFEDNPLYKIIQLIDSRIGTESVMLVSKYEKYKKNNLILLHLKRKFGNDVAELVKKYI